MPGSSPHTRGTQFFARQDIGMQRFIPAYAGNASVGYHAKPVVRVHPRIRGERPPDPSSLMNVAGSSPHTRGTLTAKKNPQSVRRFIPAYAGNARSSIDRRAQRSVHPRIRGERDFIGCPQRGVVGSSPHTRGTHLQAEKDAAKARFIPAYAGNAGRRRRQMPGPTVHPRIRGERDITRPCAHTKPGSSPHTRGTHSKM